jgi:hypothetical protein
VVEVGDEAALEPAKKTLSLVARRWDAAVAALAAVENGVRRLSGRTRASVEVRRAGDEGVRRHDEQQQTRRRARPHESLPPSLQAVAQVLLT